MSILLREMGRTGGYIKRKKLTEINAMPVEVDLEEAANPKQGDDATMR
jgi:hypothetical protein